VVKVAFDSILIKDPEFIMPLDLGHTPTLFVQNCMFDVNKIISNYNGSLNMGLMIPDIFVNKNNNNNNDNNKNINLQNNMSKLFGVKGQNMINKDQNMKKIFGDNKNNNNNIKNINMNNNKNNNMNNNINNNMNNNKNYTMNNNINNNMNNNINNNNMNNNNNNINNNMKNNMNNNNNNNMNNNINNNINNNNINQFYDKETPEGEINYQQYNDNQYNPYQDINLENSGNLPSLEELNNAKNEQAAPGLCPNP
jgi:hypothetical protein